MNEPEDFPFFDPEEAGIFTLAECQDIEEAGLDNITELRDEIYRDEMANAYLDELEHRLTHKDVAE